VQRRFVFKNKTSSHNTRISFVNGPASSAATAIIAAPMEAPGFQEEEECADKARAQSNAGVPVTLPDESAGKSREDIMLAARPTEVRVRLATDSLAQRRA
jgi:hypothetical protein